MKGTYERGIITVQNGIKYCTYERGIIRVQDGKAFCPSCRQGKLIKGGIDKDTEIRNMTCICSWCKNEYKINIEPEPSA